MIDQHIKCAGCTLFSHSRTCNSTFTHTHTRTRGLPSWSRFWIVWFVIFVGVFVCVCVCDGFQLPNGPVIKHNKNVSLCVITSWLNSINLVLWWWLYFTCTLVMLSSVLTFRSTRLVTFSHTVDSRFFSSCHLVMSGAFSPCPGIGERKKPHRIHTLAPSSCLGLPLWHPPWFMHTATTAHGCMHFLNTSVS